MSHNAVLTLCAVTRLEYEDESSLTESVQASLEKKGITRNEASVTGVELPGTVYAKTVFRRQHAGGVEEQRGAEGDICLVLPEGERVSILLDITAAIPDDFSAKLEEYLRDLSAGWIRIGQNITLGCGVCVLQDLTVQDESYAALLKPARLIGLYGKYQRSCAHMEIVAASDAGILIRNRDKGSAAPYAVNRNGEAIIPASTWKGIFRSSMSQWVSYYKRDENIIYEMFGNREKGIKGNLIFFDSIIRNAALLKENRVHIDKLTNDVISIQENTYVAGDFTIEIDCMGDLERYKPYIALVLRDFSIGRINVGADYGTGKGIIWIKG